MEGEPDAESLPPELDENTHVVWPTDPETDLQKDENVNGDGKPSTSKGQAFSYWFGGRVEADEDQVEEDQEDMDGLEEEHPKPSSRKSRKKSESDDPDWTEENDGRSKPGKKRKRDTPKQFSRFRFQWTDEFQWLHYNAVAKLMFCKLCRQARKPGEFSTLGCSEFDKAVLYAHDISKEHIEAECEAKRVDQDRVDDFTHDASLLAPEKSDIPEDEEDADPQNTLYSEVALVVALKTAYYAAQNQGDKNSSHVYKSMMALQDSCNVVGAKELRLGKQPEKCFVLKQSDESSSSAEYAFGDDESLSEMHDVLARIVQEDMYYKITQSDFVTIVIQENPDIDLQALQVQLVIHARYTHKGSLCVGFLGTVIVMEDKPVDAVKEIMQVLQDCDIPVRKVVAVQILCQKKNGKSVVSSSIRHWQMAEQFTQVKDIIVLISAQRHPSWNTCVSIATQQLEEGTKLQHMLGRLVIYLQSISNKLQATEALKELVSNPLCQWDGLQMPAWMMVHKTAQVISSTWSTLIEVLETEASAQNDSQAQQFLDELQKYQFLAFIHLLLDLIPMVKDAEIQLNDKTPEEAYKHAMDALNNLQENSGDNEMRFLKHLDLEKRTFCNHHIYFSEQQQEGANQMRANFIGKVSAQIKSRCEVLRKADQVRRLFQILNPRVLVSFNESNEMGEYGRDELQQLAKEFLDSSSDKDFFPEYQEMKMVLYRYHKTDSFQAVLEKINPTKKSQKMNATSIGAQRCPNMVKLLRCSVTIPGVCRQSDQKVALMLKASHDYMEKYGTEANTLSRMMIANHGTKMNEFDFINALQEWNTV